jgi:hypothetical protein
VWFSLVFAPKTPLGIARAVSTSLFEMIQVTDGQGAASLYGPETDEIGQTPLHKAVLDVCCWGLFGLLPTTMANRVLLLSACRTMQIWHSSCCKKEVIQTVRIVEGTCVTQQQAWQSNHD